MLLNSAIKLDDNLIISKIGGNTTDFTFSFTNHLGYVVLPWSMSRETYDLWLEEPGYKIWPNSFGEQLKWSNYSLVEKFKLVLERLQEKWKSPS